MMDSSKDGYLSIDNFVGKIRILAWFIAPRENQQIKQSFSEKKSQLGIVGQKRSENHVTPFSLTFGIFIG